MQKAALCRRSSSAAVSPHFRHFIGRLRPEITGRSSISSSPPTTVSAVSSSEPRITSTVSGHDVELLEELLHAALAGDLDLALGISQDDLHRQVSPIIAGAARCRQ